MQPYFLPYLGYYKLLNAVDKFVIYDDVNFINRGWVNRNNILVGGKEHLFTVPLQNASQNKLIHEIQLSPDANWRKKLLKTIDQSYRKAPHFDTAFPLLEDIINDPAEDVAAYCRQSLVKTAKYLKIDTEIVPTSRQYGNSALKAQERILDICKLEGADHYINPINGQELYDKTLFKNEGIRLSFIKRKSQAYRQFKNEFVPWLSVTDALMFNSVAEMQEVLQVFELI